MQKPPAKPAPAPAAKEEAPVAAPPKSKKMLIIGIVVLLVIIAGGAGWFFSKGSAPAAAGHEEAAKKTELAHEAKFVPLGENFTVNLQREEGDQYLQAGITLKILQPELEEKIKTQMPEIRSKLLFLLSGKKPSELQTMEGKKKLISEIIAEVDGALGLGKSPSEETPKDAGSAVAADSAVAAAQATPEPKTTGVVDVLFTSFIIQ
jgi:flagellar FliL protein